MERWARELAARLPALRPGGYAVRAAAALVAPRRARLGAARAAGPRARARGALLCPANLAPVAARNAVVVIHDAAALRHPGLVLRALRGLAARGCCR